MKRKFDYVLLIAWILLAGSIACTVLLFSPDNEPEITVQPEKPTREYIRKYPIAGGGYQYILVREYELSVEFVDTISGGEDD